MVNYSKGKIYKIISSKTDKIYIGSTTSNLSIRMANHRNHYRQWKKNNKYFYMSSFEVVKYPDAKIILLENWRCSSRDSLVAREQQYIDSEKNCCNIQNAKLKTRCDWCDFDGHPLSGSDLKRHKKSHGHKANKKYWNKFIDSLK